MKKQVILKYDIDIVKDKFQKAITDNDIIRLKWSKENRFELKSVENFGTINMLEKEHYYISVYFVPQNDGYTLMKYTIRSNATFRILCFIIPFMSLPTLIIGLDNRSFLIETILLFLFMVGISIILLLYTENTFKLKGNTQFNKFLQCSVF